MQKTRPRRSVLYMPGANERALEKARMLACDAVILDLEDSVAPEAKLAARKKVTEAVREGGYGRREVVIRPNPLESAWGAADLIAAAAVAPDAILIPKVAHPGDIISAAKILKSVDAPEKTKLWAMVETPMSVLYAREIAAVGADPENRLVCLVMGTNDLLKESRARALHNRLAVIPWLALAIVAARAYGLDIIDGVYNDFKDNAGFREECEYGRTLGMDGKTLIHPSQIDACNEIFTPSGEEVAWAKAIIRAFDQTENAKKGVITVDGKMVERLHLVQAQRTVAIANSVKEIEEWFEL